MPGAGAEALSGSVTGGPTVVCAPAGAAGETATQARPDRIRRGVLKGPRR